MTTKNFLPGTAIVMLGSTGIGYLRGIFSISTALELAAVGYIGVIILVLAIQTARLAATRQPEAVPATGQRGAGSLPGQILIPVPAAATVGALVALVLDLTWASHWQPWLYSREIPAFADPSFLDWISAHPHPPWHILRHSPLWQWLAPGSAWGPVNIWYGYAWSAWKAPAAGALAAAIFATPPPRSPQIVAFSLRAIGLVARLAAAVPIAVLDFAATCARLGWRFLRPTPPPLPPPPAQPEPRPVSAPIGALARLRAAVGEINADAALTGEIELALIARHPALGEVIHPLDPADYSILDTALRTSGRWETVRRRRGGEKIQVWRRTTDRRAEHGK